MDRLIRDIGGYAEASRVTGKARTAPYRWVKQGYVSTKVICALKESAPHIDIDDYIVEKK